MPRARRQGENRVLTVPNGLTALRLVCLPVFLVLLAQPHGRDLVAAACMLGALGVTDGLDGYIARHFHQVSSLGKLADPFVDRALVLSAVIGAVAIGAVPAWLVAIVLLREALVLVGAVVLALAGARHLDVSLAGKVGAFGMMVALPLFLLGHAPFRWHDLAGSAAWVAVACGQVFAWYAAAQYIPTGRALLAEARKGQSRGQDEPLVAHSGDGRP
ncbi:MAG: CDP-alcohol phosphatidyltransferase family protein [Acidimicrobiales bacterium]|jgi:cardiolipin synthase